MTSGAGGCGWTDSGGQDEKALLCEAVSLPGAAYIDGRSGVASQGRDAVLLCVLLCGNEVLVVVVYRFRH